MSNQEDPTKQCAMCNQVLPVDKFYKNGGYYSSKCKECSRTYGRSYYKENKDDRLGYYRDNKWDLKRNRMFTGSIDRNWKDLRDKLNQSKFCGRCGDYTPMENFYADSGRRDGLDNKCKGCADFLKKSRINQNISEYRKRWRAYERRKRKEDVGYRIKANLRARLSVLVSNGQRDKRMLELLGCSIPELRAYLEKQFREGMSWDNYGMGGWHIDHKKPCSGFNLERPEHQEKCFHYTNLQPLWEADNLSKNDTPYREWLELSARGSVTDQYGQIPE